MGIFGGAQVISILCAIIRTKLVAVWIGPAGVGLFGLFNNAIEMLSTATSLGIRNSSVRDMAIARQSGKAKLVSTTIAVVKKWAWFTSIGGAVLTIALAPLLSRITFGTESHTWEFVLLSVVLMFNGLTGGEQAILQGNSALKRLAHASVWGVVGGLVISIPMFYFWREASIVPSIVAYSAMVLLFTLLFRHKDYTPVKVSVKEAYSKGKEFVRLGIYMTVSLFVTLLFAYIFSVYLNYTSGTTGFSKGVMLTGNNLAGNVTYAQTLDLLFRGDRELCFLPLAHAYSCAFNFLVPMAVGAHVYLLGKVPSPKILLKAFEEIKPNLILTVPLILEKIYKKMILPQLSKTTMKVALNIPLLDSRIYAQICKHLVDAMGGRFREIIVGGAAMNQEVTDFLYKIKFPFTIGYGMTECGPLISYDNHKEYVPGSCGQILKGILPIHCDIVLKLLPADPDRLLIDIRLIGQKLAASSVLQHILYRVPKVSKSLGKTVRDNFIFHKFCQSALGLGGHNPWVKPSVCKLKAQQLIHVIAFLPGHSKRKNQHTKHNGRNFPTFFP